MTNQAQPFGFTTHHIRPTKVPVWWVAFPSTRVFFSHQALNQHLRLYHQHDTVVVGEIKGLGPLIVSSLPRRPPRLGEQNT